MRTRTILLTAMFLLSAFSVFATAQGQTQDLTVPEPLAPSPETTSFLIDATHNDKTNCHDVVRRDRSGMDNPPLLATNNENDPCRNKGPITASGRANDFAQTHADADFRVGIVGDHNGTVMQEGEKITGTIWMFTENAGYLKPKVRIDIDRWHDVPGDDVGTWNSTWEAPEAWEHQDEGVQWKAFDFELDAPPTILEGNITLRIWAPNPSVNDPELHRLSGTKWGIGIDADHQSTLVLPFDEQPEPEPETVETGAGECVEAGAGDNETSANVTACADDGNATVDANATANNTTVEGNVTVQPDNNTTAANITTSDKGLPGFEAVGVIGASLVAIAVAARGRPGREDLVKPGARRRR